MRTVLVTGAGGAGRTTVAAATALAAARAGRRTLLLGTDQDGTAEALLGLPAAPSGEPFSGTPAPWSTPRRAAPGLWVAGIAPDDWLRGELTALQARCAGLLDMLGATPLDGEELAELPGARALALLHALYAAAGQPRVGVQEPETAAAGARPPAPGPGPAADAGPAAGAAHGSGHEDPGPDGGPVGGERPPGQGLGGGSGADGVSAGGWQAVVVDMPSTHEAVGALALPEQLRRYLRRLLPAERQAARALRPMLAQLAGVPMPASQLYEQVARWDRRLAAVQEVIAAESTTVRLVVEPGPLAARALRTARAGLALHGCRVEALVANRLLPEGSADPWLAAWSAEQRAALAELRAWSGESSGDPVRELPHLGRTPSLHAVADTGDGAGAATGDPRSDPDGRPAAGTSRAGAGTPAGAGGTASGPGADDAAPASGAGPGVRGGRGVRDDPDVRDAAGAAARPVGAGAEPVGGLSELAAAVGAPAPLPECPAGDPWRVEDRIAADGVLVWRLPLPGADRDALGLVRRGDELVLTVGPFHRVLPLPSALCRCTVAGAGLRDGELRVRFAPDPDLWPRGL